MRQRAAVFLDRDGVILYNRPDYVKSCADVRFLPGALQALERLATSNYAVVVITNQSAVGRGIISLRDALDINQQVLARISRRGGRIDAAYVCPHTPTANCCCRKPAPGMLLRARKELGLHLGNSYIVGDAASDIAAGQAAGVQGILVRTGRGRQQVSALTPTGACPIVANLGAAVDYILGQQ